MAPVARVVQLQRARAARLLIAQAAAHHRVVQVLLAQVVAFPAVAQVVGAQAAAVVQAVALVVEAQAVDNAALLRKNLVPVVVKILMRCCRRRSPVTRPVMLLSLRA